jgi:hypothetical protein
VLFNNFDVTGFKFRGQIKRNYFDKKPVAIFQITTESENEITINLPSSDSAKLNSTFFVYDIEMVFEEDGLEQYVARILEGKVKVTLEVTK